MNKNVLVIDDPISFEEYKKRKQADDIFFQEQFESMKLEEYKEYISKYFEYEDEDISNGYSKRRTPRKKITNITLPKKKRKKNKKTYK